MFTKLGYSYAYLNTSGRCFQVLSCPCEQPENPRLIPIPEASDMFHGKYYYNDTWYERTWNEYDENGFPVESAGYVDTPWEPNIASPSE